MYPTKLSIEFWKYSESVISLYPITDFRTDEIPKSIAVLPRIRLPIFLEASGANCGDILSSVPFFRLGYFNSRRQNDVEEKRRPDVHLKRRDQRVV